MRYFAIPALLAFQPLLCTQESPQRQTVLVAGAGSEHIATTIDQVADYLKSKGVPVKVADSPAPRNLLLQRLADSDGSMGSLLYLNMDIGAWNLSDKLQVECYDNQGKLLWKEEAKSGWYTSASGQAKKLGRSAIKKIERHVGDPGLPRAVR